MSDLVAAASGIVALVAAVLGVINTLRQSKTDERLARVKSDLDAEVHERTALIVDPPNGRIPPLTPAAQNRRAGGNRRSRPAGPEDRNVAERCILGFNAGPPMEPRAYNNFFQLFQTSDHIVILNEMVHDARIIPMDGRPHGLIGQWKGGI